MTSIRPFLELAYLCHRKGIKQAVICPGSRNALLTIAFTSIKDIKCYSVSDERSAAYMALGMSQISKKPTALICTSGTAALNFGPAVAEAFFQKVPLLILTADRPPEWVHQHDGQTVFQSNCYGNHVKGYYQWLPDQSAESIDFAERISNEAINKSIDGPVHINIPVREPFYPKEGLVSQLNQFEASWRNITHTRITNTLSLSLKLEFEKVLVTAKNPLILIGQNQDKDLNEHIELFTNNFGFTTISDCISNIKSGIKNHDLFLNESEQHKNLQPDFLLTLGDSIISKRLKLFLRNNKVKTHWHISTDTEIIDPFKSITKIIEGDVKTILKQLSEAPIKVEKKETSWEQREVEYQAKLKKFAFDNGKGFSDIGAVKVILERLTENSILHLGNSMAVRYVNVLQSTLQADTTIYCNRGTSGIDGSLSTALGHALNTDKVVYCLLGDLSFQYDKNALWNSHLPPNLKIIILNNAGGVIFQMISGPREQNAFDDFFKTKQTNKANLISKEFGLSYFSAKNNVELVNVFTEFTNSQITSVLEIFTNADESEKNYKKLISM